MHSLLRYALSISGLNYMGGSVEKGSVQLKPGCAKHEFLVGSSYIPTLHVLRVLGLSPIAAEISLLYEARAVGGVLASNHHVTPQQLIWRIHDMSTGRDWYLGREISSIRARKTPFNAGGKVRLSIFFHLDEEAKRVEYYDIDDFGIDGVISIGTNSENAPVFYKLHDRA